MPTSTPSRLLTSSKVLDFIIGFVGFYGATFVIGILLTPLSMIPLSLLNNPTMQGIAAFVQYGILLVLYICAIWYVFRKGMRVVAYGMITAIILPLLVFGACLGIIGMNTGGF